MAGDAIPFAARVLNWAAAHGRKDLPWQHEISPYRVWVSEIMLQQTRVETVIPYFERFMQRFPRVGDLADAPLDTVLAYWSGLGYYARARNLHQAAGLIVAVGRFPDTLDSLCELPGIGRSTAGAILSVAFQKRGAILDGNVKRVLARFHGVEGWPNDPTINRELWRLSEQHTPEHHCREYTQAIMDLGATVCTRRAPNCASCPLGSDCTASVQGRTGELPGSRQRTPLPVRSCYMLMLCNRSGNCYLVKRPPTGIWGGLWGFPEFAAKSELMDWCDQAGAGNLQWWSRQRHTFSHYHLDYTPVAADWPGPDYSVRENEPALWCNPAENNHLGLPAPVKRLVDRLRTERQTSAPKSI
jgi:A/G-specific adenine glycosylase